MSILNAYLTKNKFYIATDTVTSSKAYGTTIPVFFSSKTVYYPHLKCCTVTLGQTQFGINYDYFISTNHIKNVTDLLNKTISLFPEKLKKYPSLTEGINNVSIFGYNEETGQMEAYFVNFEKDTVVDHVSFDLAQPTTLIHPSLPDGLEHDIKTQAILGGGTVNDMLIGIAKAMHDNSLEEGNKTARAIGGELHLATIGINEEGFYCTFTKIWEFPDYNEMKELFEVRTLIMS